MKQKLTLIGSTGTTFVTTLGQLPRGPNQEFIQRMFLEMEKVEHDHLFPGDRFVSEMLLVCCFTTPTEALNTFTVNGVEYSKQDYAYRHYPSLQKVLIVVKKGNQMLISYDCKNKNTKPLPVAA